MGKAIHTLATQKGHTVTCTIDNPKEWNQMEKPLGLMADVAIEFSTPETATENLFRCLEEKIPVVCGTTGWLEHLEEISKAYKQEQGTLVWAPNFSPGVNLFFSLNQWLAQQMEAFPQYQTSLEEIHHTGKLDKPSGTAIHLAEQLIQAHKGLQAWKEAEAALEETGTIPITSERIEHVTGIHTVSWESEIDQITIRHTAKNRSGFALGAILAAEWIVEQKKRGVYPFNKVLFNTL